MKTRGFRRTAWALAATLPLIFALDSAAVAQCEQQVEQTLQRLGVSQDDVESVQIEKRRFGDEDVTDSYDYNAWIRLRSCGRGYLVVHMTRTCYVQESYTRGDCQVSGVTQY